MQATQQQLWPTHSLPRFPIVEVLWIDSAGTHAWRDRQTSLEDPEHMKGMLNRSVGYLLVNDERLVTLTESLSDNDSIGCSTTIPKFAIVEYRLLRSPNVTEAAPSDGEVGWTNRPEHARVT
jgi:hypothetical protein